MAPYCCCNDCQTFILHVHMYTSHSQGIANGVLLITPHSVMFKPYVSDPLVMDRGQDTYSIATLMTSVTSAAMYTDIAAMAIHDPLKPGRYNTCIIIVLMLTFLGRVPATFCPFTGSVNLGFLVDWLTCFLVLCFEKS